VTSDREYLIGLMKRLKVQADAAATCARRSAIGSADVNKGRGAAFSSVASDIKRYLDRAETTAVTVGGAR
jgi:hypothetical protein